MQRERTKQSFLSDETKSLVENGFARALMPEYRREDIYARPGMIRERECYYVGNRRFAVLLSISVSGRHTIDSISLVDFESKLAESKTKRRWYSDKNVTVAEQAEDGDTSSFGKHHGLYFKNNHGVRTLVAQMEHFGREGALYIRAELSEAPEDSLVTASSCGTDGFRLALHQNWMRVKGKICYGREVWDLEPSDSFATLTWERGAWKPYCTGWICSGSGVTDGKLPFGLHLTSEAVDGMEETMAFLDGKGYPLGAISVTPPSKWDDMEPWSISGDRLQVEFIPLLTMTDRVDKAKIRRVYGRYNGSVTLENGVTHTFVNLIGLVEQTDRKK